jgi:hypothetical protein
MTALERAFQLAKSGQVSGVEEIRRSLDREGYSGNQIHGPILKRQLTGLVKTARTRPVDTPSRPRDGLIGKSAPPSTLAV